MMDFYKFQKVFPHDKDWNPTHSSCSWHQCAAFWDAVSLLFLCVTLLSCVSHLFSVCVCPILPSVLYISVSTAVYIPILWSVLARWLRAQLLGDGLCWVYDPPICLYGKLSTFRLHLSYSVWYLPFILSYTCFVPSPLLCSCSSPMTVEDFT